MRAKLHDATLMGANLQGTVLFQADLNGVSLNVANLEQANLVEPDLQNAIFFNTRFDKLTLLPDCTFWSPETDLTRFTDPNHPQFWRSDDPASPAYRGRLSSTP